MNHFFVHENYTIILYFSFVSSELKDLVAAKLERGKKRKCSTH